MLKVFYKNLRMSEIEERQRFEKGSLIEVVEPSDEEITRLHKELGLDPDLIRESLDPFETSYLKTSHNNFVYIFVRFPIKEESGEIITLPLLIAIAENFVALVTKTQLPIIEALKESGEDLITLQKVRLVLQVLSQTNQRYEDLLHDINRQINSLNIGHKQEQINNQEVMHFISIEETLNEFISSLMPQNAIYHKLLSTKEINIYNEDKQLVENLILHSEELIALSKTTLRTSMNIRHAYSAVLSNRLNRVIKLFTSLTIIMTVAVIIPSIYGMNVALPLQRNPNAFWIIIAITVAIASILVWFFNKKRWL